MSLLTPWSSIACRPSLKCEGAKNKADRSQRERKRRRKSFALMPLFLSRWNIYFIASPPTSAARGKLSYRVLINGRFSVWQIAMLICPKTVKTSQWNETIFHREHRCSWLNPLFTCPAIKSAAAPNPTACVMEWLCAGSWVLFLFCASDNELCAQQMHHYHIKS